MVIAFEKGQQTLIEVKHIPSRHDTEKHFLQREAAEAFLEMHAAAAKDGIELVVNSSFRSMTEQKKMFRKKGPALAAQPGFSNHQFGLAVDIAGTEVYISGACNKKCPTITYWWLKRNASKFGFYQTLSHERWHWQYIPEVNRS